MSPVSRPSDVASTNPKPGGLPRRGRQFLPVLIVATALTVWFAAAFVFLYPLAAWWTASPTPTLQQSEEIFVKGNVRYVTPRAKRIVDGCLSILRSDPAPI